MWRFLKYYEKEHYLIYSSFCDDHAGAAVAGCYLRKRRWGNGGLFCSVFCVNPIYSVAIGIFAGENNRRLWSLPVISAALFLIGTWIFFDMGETAFIFYGMVYLVLGIASMMICRVFV